jgi:NTP pyrophosphatase (non-canonical NTP hydrolase)
MTLQEFYTLTQRTRNTALTQEEWLQNSALGLSEVSELDEAFSKLKDFYELDRVDEVLLEMGDVLYYNVQIVGHFMTNEFNKISLRVNPDYISLAEGKLSLNSVELISHLHNYVCKIQEAVKKSIYHKKPGALDRVLNYSIYIIEILSTLAPFLGVTMEDIMEMNINKLKKRYPDGFDPNFPTQGLLPATA